MVINSFRGRVSASPLARGLAFLHSQRSDVQEEPLHSPGHGPANAIPPLLWMPPACQKNARENAARCVFRFLNCKSSAKAVFAHKALILLKLKKNVLL